MQEVSLIPARRPVRPNLAVYGRSTDIFREPCGFRGPTKVFQTFTVDSPLIDALVAPGELGRFRGPNLGEGLLNR